MSEKLTKDEKEVIERAFGAITQVHWGDMTQEHHDFCLNVAEPLKQKILRQFDEEPEPVTPRIRIMFKEVGEDVKTTWVLEDLDMHSLMGNVLIPKELFELFLNRISRRQEEEPIFSIPKIRLEKQG